MRCTRVGWIVAFGFLAAACHSEAAPDAAGTEASNPPAATAAPVPSTTAAAIASTSAAATTVAPASITPFVLCFDSYDGEPTDDAFYFGYENSGAEPVVLEDGAANSLTASRPDDHPLVPTVFAPGRVPAAFLAMIDNVDALPSWTIVGPDGESRTAQATGDEPVCNPELLPQDERAPTIEYTYRGLPEGAAAFEQVEITATVVDLPETSVCASGLRPEPVEIELSGAGVTAAGSVAVAAVPIGPLRTVSGGTVGVDVEFSATVIDRCGSGGAVSRSWPAPPFNGVVFNTPLCLQVDGTTIEPGGCLRLPPTGGARLSR